jgi:hypothetical protein
MTQTYTEDVVIDGSSDVTQLTVQGNSTQTEPLQVWEDSAGTDLLRITDDGSLQADGGVQVEGSADAPQLTVKGHSSQTNPLQIWEDSAGADLAQVAEDGRLQIGDIGLSTDDALVEAHRDSTSSLPKRGLHALGKITGTLSSVIAWAVAELELLGSGGVSALHSALRVKLTNQNSGAADNADLRAGDFEVVNDGGASGNPVGQAVAVQAAISNQANGYLDKAYGVKVSISDQGSLTKAYALHTDNGTVHLGDDLEIPVFSSAPTDDPDTDFIKVYSKLDGGNPKLYAKDSAGVEHTLGGGGGAIFDRVLTGTVSLGDDQQAVVQEIELETNGVLELGDGALLSMIA